ncbi:MAG TPA: paraquat-inducible protein A [Acidisphaera sp.]|nr:paraquat-inducible protein A [Acidisphaera sp.]
MLQQADLSAAARSPPYAAPTRECPDCGLVQLVPAVRPGEVAHCLRCSKVLRRGRPNPLQWPLALGLTGTILLLIALLEPLLDVSTVGMSRQASLVTGAQRLETHGLWEVAAVVAFTTMAAPLAHLFGTTWVLLNLRLGRAPAYLSRLFAIVRRLRPWSMVEVFLVGVFVAYTQLRELVHIETGVALWALIALMLVIVAVDALLDPEAVWQAMERRRPSRAPLPAYDANTEPASCETCHTLADRAHTPHCPRCGMRLHARKPRSLQRTWALAIVALVLYIPANTYPVLTYTEFGIGSPHTILSGVRELLDFGQWPLALIVFLASVAIPVLKLVSLFTMLIATQRGSAARLHDRAVLYRIVEVIGRWSMIDIFVETILVALVQFGGIVTIDPGVGAIAFASVVILTMLAAENFDPRLMWDAAAGRAAPRVARDAG